MDNMDLNEIKFKINNLEQALDLDREIVEHLVQDMIFSKNFFVIDFENDPSISDEFINNLKKFGLDRFNSEGENKIIKAIHDEQYIPSEYSVYDCFLVISSLGKDDNLLNFVESAMSKKSLVYALCSDSRSNLLLNVYDFIKLTADGNFDTNVNMFFKMIIYELHYFFESDFFEVDSAPRLDLFEDKLEENLASSGYISPFYKRKNKKRKIGLYLLIIANILFYGFLFYIMITAFMNLFN